MVKEELSSVVVGEIDGIIRYLIDTIDDSPELLKYVMEKINEISFSRKTKIEELKNEWKGSRFFVRSGNLSFTSGTLFVRVELDGEKSYCVLKISKEVPYISENALNECLYHVGKKAWKEITLTEAIKLL
jgi:hypothetical protein